MIADMHCHLDLYPDYVRVARDASTQGIWVLAVTTTPKAWQGTRERLKSFPNIHVAVGLHPELAQLRANELPLIESLVGGTEFIGEVGLDGSPELRKHADIQQKIFRQILYSCEKAGGKVLTIHSRRAVTEVLGCIEERRECGLPILHWFTGSKSELEFAKRLDCWFSVGRRWFEHLSVSTALARCHETEYYWRPTDLLARLMIGLSGQQPFSK